MSDQATTLDMTMMYAVHDALRREVTQLARITSRVSDDPRRILQSAVGWEMFKSYLHVHHTCEDATVWPVMRQALADRPDDLELLDAMESEHAAIDPLLDQVDAALVDRDHGHERFGEIIDSLVTVLTGHLDHEEADALRLIDSTMTPEQWQVFGEDHRNRIGSDARRYLPWVLDSAKPAHVEAILGRVPDHLRQAYHDEWLEAYSRLDRWGTGKTITT